MTDYLISVSEGELRAHPEYEALTAMLGDPVIWDHKFSLEKPAIYLGLGDDSRRYFVSTREELGDVVERLLPGMQSTVRIQKGDKENLPANLKEMYERFFQTLAKIANYRDVRIHT